MGRQSRPDSDVLAFVVNITLLVLLSIRALSMWISAALILRGEDARGDVYTQLDGFNGDLFGGGTDSPDHREQESGVLQRQRRGSSFKNQYPISIECPVCIEPIRASSSADSDDACTQLQCKHAMHEECARKLEGYGLFSCPLCRADCLERGEAPGRDCEPNGGATSTEQAQSAPTYRVSDFAEAVDASDGFAAEEGEVDASEHDRGSTANEARVATTNSHYDLHGSDNSRYEDL